MRLFACTTDRYDDLYARWLEKPGVLLDLGSYEPDDRLLDLCGGTGVVSREALRRGGRSVTLLDLHPRCPDKRVTQVKGPAEDADLLLGDRKFDYVVCRQALAYLSLERTMRAVSRITQTGSVFVFNTFKQPKWAFRRYTYGGHRFIEASGFYGNRVGHVQIGRAGIDFTLFRWYERDAIMRALEPYFFWTMCDDGPSIRWCATRKGFP